MTTVNASTHKCCALCKRWDGDAKLSGQGAPRGFVKFDNYARGKCVYLNNQNKIANEGTGCQYYSISVEADRFA